MGWFNKEDRDRWVSDMLNRSLEPAFKHMERLIMSTREELVSELGSIKDLVVKSRKEWRARVDGLEQKLLANQPITLDDLADLKRVAKESDDDNPDVATDTPETNPPETEQPSTETPETTPPVEVTPDAPVETLEPSAPITSTPPTDTTPPAPETSTPATDTTPPAPDTSAQ